MQGTGVTKESTLHVITPCVPGQQIHYVDVREKPKKLSCHFAMFSDKLVLL